VSEYLLAITVTNGHEAGTQMADAAPKFFIVLAARQTGHQQPVRLLKVWDRKVSSLIARF
jgi:hypothetical protein